MCTVSYIGDTWKRDRLPEYPWTEPYISPYPYDRTKQIIITPGVSQEEFEKLKKEVEALKEMLKAAKIYDAATNQPDCEIDEKVEIIKKVAQLVGVDLEEIFERKKNT